MTTRSFILASTTLISLSGLTACATIIEGSEQQINVASAPAPASSCVLRNERGEWRTGATPTSVTVKRSTSPLHVTCGNPTASGTAMNSSSLEPWTFGNILLGGIFGLAIDGATGAMSEYKDQVTVAMNTGGAAPAPTAYYEAPIQPAPQPAVSSYEPNVIAPAAHPSYYSVPSTWSAEPPVAQAPAPAAPAAPVLTAPASVSVAPAPAAPAAVASQPGLLPLPPAYPASYTAAPPAPVAPVAPAPALTTAAPVAPAPAPAYAAPQPAAAPTQTLVAPGYVAPQPAAAPLMLKAPSTSYPAATSQQNPYMKPSRYQ